MAGPFINDIACVCENGGSFRTYGQYGSYGSLCTSCGAQGPVTSLMAILPRDHSKAKISVDQSPGDEVVGSVAAYQEWIMERAGAGKRVWIDSCACDRCGGSISVEVVDQLVTERCRSCQHEIQYVSTIPLPYTVPLEPRHYRIRDPHPKAEAISLVRKVMSPNLEMSLASVGESLKFGQGVLLTFEDTSSAEPILDRLALLGCQIKRIPEP